MHGMKEIMREAESLPIEERAVIIDYLLRSLNPTSSEIAREWAEVAKRRLTELLSGRVMPVSGSVVFGKIRQRFEKLRLTYPKS